MQTNPRNSYVDFGNAGAVNLVKVGLAQHGLRRMDEQASEGTEIVAHMKVIAPLTSTGPSIRARVVNASASVLTVRFPHIVFTGALVQIRIHSRILFGKARRCIAKESEYEIEIEKQRSIERCQNSADEAAPLSKNFPKLDRQLGEHKEFMMGFFAQFIG
jgi:hypothetical protein